MRARLGVCLLLCAIALQPRAEVAPDGTYVELSAKRMPCKRDLYVHGKQRTYYPRGKGEWVGVEVPGDIVIYECGLLRYRLVCNLGTVYLQFRRIPGAGVIDFRCMGTPLQATVPAIGETAADAEAAATQDGSAPVAAGGDGTTISGPLAPPPVAPAAPSTSNLP
jgi:hypothetical protein